MNINPLDSSAHLHSLGHRPHANGARHDAFVPPAGDRFSADDSAAIRSALDAIPEIRPEVVERGRRLLADPNYPSAKVVDAIARLITPLPED